MTKVCTVCTVHTCSISINYSTIQIQNGRRKQKSQLYSKRKFSKASIPFLSSSPTGCLTIQRSGTWGASSRLLHTPYGSFLRGRENHSVGQKEEMKFIFDTYLVNHQSVSQSVARQGNFLLLRKVWKRKKKTSFACSLSPSFFSFSVCCGSGRR